MSQCCLLSFSKYSNCFSNFGAMPENVLPPSPALVRAQLSHSYTLPIGPFSELGHWLGASLGSIISANSHSLVFGLSGENAPFLYSLLSFPILLHRDLLSLHCQYSCLVISLLGVQPLPSAKNHQPRDTFPCSLSLPTVSLFCL